MTACEEMKALPALLFLLGYFAGGYGVIWILVMKLEEADTKFTGAVGFYYGLWIAFYLPIAIFGTIGISRMAGKVGKRLVAATVGSAAVLLAMFVSFYFDIHWTVLFVEYLVFGVGFWILAMNTNSTEQVEDPNRAAAE